MPVLTPPDPLTTLPDPDAIRAAIDATDARARLLRQLLRLAMRSRLHLTTADRLPIPTPRREGGDAHG